MKRTLDAEELRKVLNVSASAFERIIHGESFPTPVWDHWNADDIRRWFRKRQHQEERDFKKRLKRVLAQKRANFEF
jgi:hypothetical protein